MNTSAVDWTIAAHLEYSDRNDVVIVKQQAGKISIKTLEASAATGLDVNHVPAFWGINDRDEALVFDPVSREVSRQTVLASDTRFAYAYRDPNSVRVWFMNDGDKNGNDTLACAENGASVTIAAKTNGKAEFVETLCAGRGHHVTTFVGPTKTAGGIPHRAFVSNLKDGTIHVVGNDPNDAVSFLKIIATINLCDPRHEESANTNVPNNASPHGMEFSHATGKLYNLNNGYNTVAVIDPLSHEVENAIPIQVSSNLLLSRCGNFLIGKGADRKADLEHVMGRLSVLDARKEEITNVLDIKDFYPSVYRFNPNGDKLYVTAAATGKDAQFDNLRTDIVQVYDTSKLPELRLIKEIKLEQCTSGRRPIAFLERKDIAPMVFIPNPTQGSLAIVDGGTDEIVDTVAIGDANIHEFSFSFWNNRAIYGA